MIGRLCAVKVTCVLVTVLFSLDAWKFVMGLCSSEVLFHRVAEDL